MPANGVCVMMLPIFLAYAWSKRAAGRPKRRSITHAEKILGPPFGLLGTAALRLSITLQ